MVPFVQKYYKQLVLVVAAVFMATMAMMTFSAQAAVTEWDQGFETNKDGWLDSSDSGWEAYGTIERTASGVGGITSSDGEWHATAEGGARGPFSLFDGYRSDWPGTWTAEIDVYLDPEALEVGEGFDYSVASNNISGGHLRDFIFHVGVVADATDLDDGKKLLVNGSNNTDFTTNPFKLNNDNGGANYTVETAGWYTLQHVFSDDSGALSVDLNLVDETDTVVWTATRTNVADQISTVVGGNRYAWFTFIDVDGGIAVDNHQLVLNDAVFQPTGEITSPEEDEEVTGELVLGATYDDGDEDNDDAVQWAVRAGTCAAGTGTVAGNVDDFNDPYTWDGATFAASLDTTTWADGEYCFVFNPADDAGQNNVRETREFSINNFVIDKEACKDGGWVMGLDGNNDAFKNQGHCVSHFASGEVSTTNRNKNR